MPAQQHCRLAGLDQTAQRGIYDDFLAEAGLKRNAPGGVNYALPRPCANILRMVKQDRAFQALEKGARGV